MAEEEIPIEKLYSQPIVQELLDKVEKIKEQPKNIENIKIPYVIKNKVLMSPGVWNNYYYSSHSIKDAFLKTRWDNKEVRSLFLDHLDKSSREWIGEIQNPRLSGEDLVGDLIFVDKPTAQKLAYGAKMGISPKVHGQEDNNKMVSFVYDNFSVVINPAVKTAYINNMEVTKMAEETKEEPKAEAPKEETPKEEPKAEAPKEEAPKEEAPKEETPPAIESAEAIIYALSEIETKMGVADVAKKAKAIRKEGEAWSAAIKRAAKMMAEEGEGEKPKEETPKEEAPKEESPKEEPKAEEGKENKEKTPEMLEADAVSQIIKLAELLQKKKPEDEKKEKYPEPEEKENKKMDKMSSTIKTLSEQVTTLTEKLNEPDKISHKTQELSEDNAVKLIEKDPDSAFLNVLNRMSEGGN